jgi:hypothetical protein
MTYKVGNKVRKVKGYSYFGIVVAAFQTLKGEDRYVVESTSLGSKGILFIFNDGQLVLAEATGVDNDEQG